MSVEDYWIEMFGVGVDHPEPIDEDEPDWGEDE